MSYDLQERSLTNCVIFARYTQAQLSFPTPPTLPTTPIRCGLALARTFRESPLCCASIWGWTSPLRAHASQFPSEVVRYGQRWHVWYHPSELQLLLVFLCASPWKNLTNSSFSASPFLSFEAVSLSLGKTYVLYTFSGLLNKWKHNTNL